MPKNEKEKKKPERAKIEQHKVFELWSKSGGRCEFKGCNKELWQEGLTSTKVNTSNIAHIIAASEDGPRGDKILSPKLAKDVSNLMLLCKEHHHDIIDKALVDIYTVDVLRKMKKEHEDRIRIVTNIKPDKKSKILIYSTKIGKRAVHLSEENIANTLLPEKYPDGDIIRLNIETPWSDNDDENNFYWDIEVKNLNDQFRTKVKPYLDDNTIKHLSIFAMACQPLLIYLGYLIGDVVKAEVFQPNRVSQEEDWKWQKDYDAANFIVDKPKTFYRKTPALSLSLSGSINHDSIKKVLGQDCDIWTISALEPNPNIIKAKNQLCAFKEYVRKVLDEIKNNYQPGTFLNVFAAMPVSANVEFGRLILPRADMPMKIYNLNDKSTEYKHAITINNKEEN